MLVAGAPLQDAPKDARTLIYRASGASVTAEGPAWPPHRRSLVSRLRSCYRASDHLRPDPSTARIVPATWRKLTTSIASTTHVTSVDRGGIGGRGRGARKRGHANSKPLGRADVLCNRRGQLLRGRLPRRGVVRLDQQQSGRLGGDLARLDVHNSRQQELLHRQGLGPSSRKRVDAAVRVEPWVVRLAANAARERHGGRLRSRLMQTRHTDEPAPKGATGEPADRQHHQSSGGSPL